MAKKQVEIQHRNHLLAGGPNKMWRIGDLRLSLGGTDEAITAKRSLERWIAAIPWLKSSHQAIDQVDEFNRPARQLVLDFLVMSARKKRRAALFVQLNRLPNVGDDQQTQEYNVLVAEDGKGAKRWCLLCDDETPSLLAGLTLLAAGKPTIFFPSGSLVVTCREFERLGQSVAKDIDIDIATGQFPEPNSSNDDYMPETKTMAKTQPTKLSHLDRLEAESLYIIREVMAHAENPVMMYSVGKDSAVMLHLARKAFYPSPPPFPLLHVDTRWKFQAMYDFRDAMAKASNMELIVHTNPEGIEKNINPFDHGSALHTDIMKTQGLKQALDLHKFDVAFGGARRDEEKSRAKERIFFLP
jgi:sulfate adenylyltransferase subunit 2